MLSLLKLVRVDASCFLARCTYEREELRVWFYDKCIDSIYGYAVYDAWLLLKDW